MIQRIAYLLTCRRSITFISFAAITLVAARFAVLIDFDFTPRVIFSGHGDMVAFSEDFHNVFGHEEATLMIVLEAVGADDALCPEALNWQGTVADRLGRLRQIDRVRCLATASLPTIRILPRPTMVSAPVVREFPPDEASTQRVREIVDDYGVFDGVLVSRDRRVAAVVCTLNSQAEDMVALRGLVDNVRVQLTEISVPKGFMVHLTGLPVLRADIISQLMAEQMRFLPMLAILFFAFLWLMFRSMNAALLPLVASGASLAWTLAVIYATGGSLNLVSNVLPVLLFILGASNSVHVTLRYVQEIRSSRPAAREITAQRTIARMMVPCFLAFFTSAIGFSSLLAARSSGLQSFAWQATLGMGFAFAGMLLAMGALLATVHPPKTSRQRTAFQRGWQKRLLAIPEAAIRHPVAVLVLGIAFVLASVLLGRHVRIDSRMVETYEPTHPAVKSVRLLEGKLGGFLALEVSLGFADQTLFLKPHVCRQITAFTHSAGQLDHVLSVHSYVDILNAICHKTRRQTLSLDGSSGSGDVLAGQLHWTDTIARDHADDTGYRAFLSDDNRRARIVLRVEDIGTQQTFELIDRVEVQLSELRAAVPGIETRLTGEVYLNAVAIDRLIREIFYSLIGVSVVIFGVIGALFRSLRLGLIVTLPNLLPLAATLGYMGLCGYDLNVANVIVFAIAIGVVVDDTVHLVARFREELRSGHKIESALRRTVRGTGRAIVITTVMVLVGLSVLLTSEFVPSRRFAELTAVAISTALLGDLLVLPACLRVFWSEEVRIDRHDERQNSRTSDAERLKAPKF